MFPGWEMGTGLQGVSGKTSCVHTEFPDEH